MTTVKVCTTGNTNFTDFEVSNHEAGCPCFAGSSLLPCFACLANERPRYYRVTLAGFAAAGCTDCNTWNGTYILEVPAGFMAGNLSGFCSVAMNLDCDDAGAWLPPRNIRLYVQMIEGSKLAPRINMFGAESDFWNIRDVIAKGHYYLWVTIGNGCGQWPSSYPLGQPFCGCAAPGDDGYMGTLYLLDMGTTAPDCLRFGPVNVPLIRKTGDRDLTVCSRAWDKCTTGTVTVGSL